MLNRNSYGFINGIKTIAGCRCRNYWHRAFAISSIICLQQDRFVLFLLAILLMGRHVEYHKSIKGISSITAKPIASAFKAMPGPLVVVTPRLPP